MDTFLGFITAFPWAWPPRDWSTCQGQTLQIQQNTALYALLGVSFGGNGQTTFMLPELRGRQIIGYGQSQATGTVFQFAEKAGAEKVLLNTSQTPVAAHTHAATFTPGGASGSSSLSVSTAAPSAATPLLTNGQTAYLANASSGINLKGLYTTTAPAAGATATIPVNGGGSGGGTVTVNPAAAPAAASVPLMNPYLALNFCIAINGLFPSRN